MRGSRKGAKAQRKEMMYELAINTLADERERLRELALRRTRQGWFMRLWFGDQYMEAHNRRVAMEDIDRAIDCLKVDRDEEVQGPPQKPEPPENVLVRDGDVKPRRRLKQLPPQASFPPE